MGIFSSLKSAVRKSEAAVVIEKLIEEQVAHGLLEVNPHLFANKLVQGVWDKNPELFGTHNKNLPAKLPLAAAALSRGIRALDGVDQEVQLALVVSLGFVLTQVSTGRAETDWTQLDIKLVEAASSVYAHYSA
jgi:hypothetical protein